MTVDVTYCYFKAHHPDVSANVSKTAMSAKQKHSNNSSATTYYFTSNELKLLSSPLTTELTCRGVSYKHFSVCAPSGAKTAAAYHQNVKNFS